MLPRTSTAEQNLILTGYLGPNQAALARGLAETLRLPLADFQAQLEQKTGFRDEDIRARFGEASLKTVESETVNQIALYRGAVIAMGGASLLRGDHLARMSATGIVIGVFASLDAVLHRFHLALGARYNDPRERQFALGTVRREWTIRGAPGVIEIDTTRMTDRQMIDVVAAAWREKAGVIDWRR